MKLFSLLICLLSILVHQESQAQLRLGQWRAHISYNSALKSVDTDEFIYCATDNGIYNVEKSNFELTRLSTIDGLSAVNVQTIDYDKESKAIFISYKGGMVDMIQENKITAIPYIYNSSNIIGDKTVYEFTFHDGMAYFATAFGVVAYEIANKQVRESYLDLSEEGDKLAISDIAIYNGRIYVATEIGLRSADLKDNLLDFNFWKTDLAVSCHLLQVFNNQLILVLSDRRILTYDGSVSSPFEPLKWAKVNAIDVYHDHLIITKEKNVLSLDNSFSRDSVVLNFPSHCLIDENNDFWVSSRFYGLIKMAEEDLYLKPNGPSAASAWNFAYNDEELWVASGGVDNSFNPRFLNNGIYVFKDQLWQNYNLSSRTEFSNFRDFHQIVIDPINNTKYAASFNRGIAVFDKDNNLTQYNQDNSDGAIQTVGNSSDPEALIYMSGIALDTSNNLWMAQQLCNDQLAVRISNGKWQSFNLGPEKKVTDLAIDEIGQKWVVVHLKGIYVLNDGGTPLNTTDDKITFLSKTIGQGNLPASDVYAITEDNDGDLWVGTGDGVAVFYSPRNVFEEDRNFDASRPLIEDDDGALGYLLEGQKVNCIAVDGANQKWFGTDDGVFATDENGDEIIYRFTENNSPLLDNTIRDIGIDSKTGEVFIATDKGIISYRAVATAGKNGQLGAYAFPNPVKPDYDGPIAITGLVANANVKITDISGNIVNETIAQGGTAVWYGDTFSGKKVASGVYLALSTNDDGEETAITKIMIIR